MIKDFTSITVSNSIRQALIDLEDYDRLCKYAWNRVTNSKGETVGICTTIRENSYTKYTVSLARAVLGFWKKGDCTLVDHKDGDSFDNRKYNLREGSFSLNSANRRKVIKTTSTSQYKGVYYRASRRKYTACIGKDYTRIVIGSFRTEEEAALAYNKKAIELFGEFALLNIIK